MCSSSTNSMGRADAAPTGFSNGENTLHPYMAKMCGAALSEVNLK